MDRRMKGKAIVLIVGVIAIGMFALPSTLAMYTGQHSFASGANVDCAKCHSGSDSIYIELTGGGPHNYFTCKQCHGFEAGNPNINNGSMGHAATTAVTCVGCHANTPYAGGPPGLDNDGVTVADELAAGAHNVFASTGDVDLACLACHTRVGVDGTIGINATSGNSIVDLSVYNY